MRLAMPNPKRAPKPAAALRLGEFLCFAVYSASHAFNRVYKPLLDELGLTYPQYLAMVLLWEQDDQTVGSLGEKLFLESSTLTPVLKRLEALGHVKRTRDPDDERQVRVRLTERGRAIRKKAREIPGCILEASGLDINELLRLQSEIVALRSALERYHRSKRSPFSADRGPLEVSHQLVARGTARRRGTTPGAPITKPRQKAAARH